MENNGEKHTEFVVSIRQRIPQWAVRYDATAAV